jgi:methylated-DNA-[protein]-cysteine S-methyltransferase
VEECIIYTPLGFAKITGNNDGITSISILNSEEIITQDIPKSLKSCALQLQEYFEGDRQQFQLQLNPKGTEFQKSVWNQLQQIPFGKHISYLKLSKQLNNVKALRAVAAANSKNPILIVIPCHRVIGRDGSLTGYAGGLIRKQWLLKHENPCKQQLLF